MSLVLYCTLPFYIHYFGCKMNKRTVCMYAHSRNGPSRRIEARAQVSSGQESRRDWTQMQLISMIKVIAATGVVSVHAAYSSIYRSIELSILCNRLSYRWTAVSSSWSSSSAAAAVSSHASLKPIVYIPPNKRNARNNTASVLGFWPLRRLRQLRPLRFSRTCLRSSV